MRTTHKLLAIKSESARSGPAFDDRWMSGIPHTTILGLWKADVKADHASQWAAVNAFTQGFWFGINVSSCWHTSTPTHQLILHDYDHPPGIPRDSRPLP